MTTKTKTSKKTVRKSAKARRTAHKPVKLEPATRIYFKAKRAKSGAKTEFLNTLPKTGVTFAKLMADIKRGKKFPAPKVPRWLKFLRAYDYVRIEPKETA